MLAQRLDCAAAGFQRLDHRARIHRPHAWQQLQHAERGERVARVVRPAQHAHHVLHVRGFEELEPAILHERNLAARKLDLEQVAVAAGAEQHRLALEQDPGLAPLQHLQRDVLRLRGEVIGGDEPGHLAAASRREEMLAMLTRRFRHQRVGNVEHGLRRPVVLPSVTTSAGGW